MIIGSRLPDPEKGKVSPYLATWPADDIGIVYCGVAGLLNVLVILDAVSRGATRKRQTVPVPPPPNRRSQA
jgi:hypothetical protein